MAYYYYKLWDILDNKCISQQELMKAAKLSNATMQKLRNDESVTVDTLNKIITVLKCDYGDILTKTSPKDDKPSISFSGEYCKAVRKVLKDYMKKNELSVNDISEMTTLSVNTIKKLLNGDVISSISISKLYRLDADFKLKLNVEIKKLMGGNPKNKKYCDQYGNKKRCLAYRRCWNPDKNEFERYCAFGFNQATDLEGFTYSLCDCPAPRTMKELMAAQEKYPYEIREKVIFIPADE